MAQSKKEIVEEELIYGARKREGFWRKLALTGWSFGIIGCLSAAAVAVFTERPAPALVPFDPATGMALPMASVGTISLNEQQAVVQSLVFAYIRDRETYNRIDNDQRVQTLLNRSEANARRSLVEQWTADNPNYPPTLYGENSRMDVEVISVTPISNDRATARIVKRLISPRGTTEGTFSVSLAYNFQPQEQRTLEALWQNPFGFSVREYVVSSERFQQ